MRCPACVAPSDAKISPPLALAVVELHRVRALADELADRDLLGDELKPEDVPVVRAVARALRQSSADLCIAEWAR